MDNLSTLINEKIKEIQEKITIHHRKKEMFLKELKFYESVGKLHEESQQFWMFLREIKDITTSLNKSIEYGK